MQQIFETQLSGNLAAWSAVIVGIIALYFGVFGPIRRANRKELSFGSSELAILPPPLIDMKDLTIQFHGEAIPGLYAVNLFVMNTGNTVIEARDFEGAIVFEFSEACRPLGSDVHSSRPASLPVSAEVEGRRIVVKPLLLNPGDYFGVFVGVVGKTVDVEPKARVSGVSEFPFLLPGETDIRQSHLLVVFASSCAVLAIGVLAVVVEPTRVQYWMVAALGVGLTSSVFALWRRMKAIKRARWMGKGTEFHKLTPAYISQLAEAPSAKATAALKDIVK